jgi:hydrogenase nickel incorporation protein HypA/HybF
MHEISLVRSMIRQVRQLASQHGGGPLLLQSAWREQSAQSEFASTVLRIDEVPLTVRCGACDHEFESVDFHFRCPCCQGGDTQIVRGDGLLLQSIALDQPSTGVVA